MEKFMQLSIGLAALAITAVAGDYLWEKHKPDAAADAASAEDKPAKTAAK